MSFTRRQRLVIAGLVGFVGLGGGVVLGLSSHPGKSPVEVQASGGTDTADDPLPLPGPPETSLPAPDPSTSSSSTTAAKPTTTTTKPRPTTTTTAAPTTTTTGVACAPAAPIYAFALIRQPDGNGWAAGGNPALQRSTDGGRTWTAACLPTDAVPGPGALHGLAFDADGHHGWVVGNSGGKPIALRTVDGGDHWLTGTLPDGLGGGLDGVAFADPQHGWAVGHLTGIGPANAAGGMVLATSDGGATWTPQAVPFEVGPPGGRLNRISVVDATHAWAVGETYGGKPAIIATGDGGATWSSQTVPDGIRELRDVAFLDRQRGWAVGALPIPSPAEPGQDDPGVVLTTSDGGATWTRQATTVGSLWSLQIIDTQTAYAGGGYGLFATHDGGTTWTKQTFRLPALDAIAFTDADHGWVTHSMYSTVCRTDDGGRTWTGSAIDPRDQSAKPCAG